MVVVVAVIPIDVTPIQRCTSIKYTFGWCILGYTSAPAEGLSEIHKEISDPPRRGSRRYTKKSGTFFFRFDYSTRFFWSGSTTLLEQST